MLKGKQNHDVLWMKTKLIFLIIPIFCVQIAVQNKDYQIVITLVAGTISQKFEYFERRGIEVRWVNICICFSFN